MSILPINVPRLYNNTNIVYDQISAPSIITVTSTGYVGVSYSNGIFVSSGDQPSFQSYEGLLYYNKSGRLTGLGNINETSLIYYDSSTDEYSNIAIETGMLYGDNNTVHFISPANGIFVSSGDQPSFQSYEGLIYYNSQGSLKSIGPIGETSLIYYDNVDDTYKPVFMEKGVCYVSDDNIIQFVPPANGIFVSSGDQPSFQSYEGLLYYNSQGSLRGLGNIKETSLIYYDSTTDEYSNVAIGNGVLYGQNNVIDYVKPEEDNSIFVYDNNTYTFQPLNQGLLYYNNMILNLDFPNTNSFLTGTNDGIKWENAKGNTMYYVDSNSSFNSFATQSELGVVNNQIYDTSTRNYILSQPHVTNQFMLNNAEVVGTSGRIGSAYILLGNPEGGITYLTHNNPKPDNINNANYYVIGVTENYNEMWMKNIDNVFSEKTYTQNINAFIGLSNNNIVQTGPPNDSNNYYVLQYDGQTITYSALNNINNITPSALIINDVFDYTSSRLLGYNNTESRFEYIESSNELEFPYLAGNTWENLSSIQFLSDMNVGTTSTRTSVYPLVIQGNDGYKLNLSGGPYVYYNTGYELLANINNCIYRNNLNINNPMFITQQIEGNNGRIPIQGYSLLTVPNKVYFNYDNVDFNTLYGFPMCEFSYSDLFGNMIQINYETPVKLCNVISSEYVYILNIWSDMNTASQQNIETIMDQYNEYIQSATNDLCLVIPTTFFNSDYTSSMFLSNYKDSIHTLNNTIFSNALQLDVDILKNINIVPTIHNHIFNYPTLFTLKLNVTQIVNTNYLDGSSKYIIHSIDNTGNILYEKLSILSSDLLITNTSNINLNNVLMKDTDGLTAYSSILSGNLIYDPENIKVLSNPTGVSVLEFNSDLSSPKWVNIPSSIGMYVYGSNGDMIPINAANLQQYCGITVNENNIIQNINEELIFYNNSTNTQGLSTIAYFNQSSSLNLLQNNICNVTSACTTFITLINKVWPTALDKLASNNINFVDLNNYHKIKLEVTIPFESFSMTNTSIIGVYTNLFLSDNQNDIKVIQYTEGNINYIKIEPDLNSSNKMSLIGLIPLNNNNNTLTLSSPLTLSTIINGIFNYNLIENKTISENTFAQNAIIFRIIWSLSNSNSPVNGFIYKFNPINIDNTYEPSINIQCTMDKNINIMSNYIHENFSLNALISDNNFVIDSSINEYNNNINYVYQPIHGKIRIDVDDINFIPTQIINFNTE